MEQQNQFAKILLILTIMGCAIGFVVGLSSNLHDSSKSSESSEELPVKSKRFVVIERINLTHFHIVHIRDAQSGKEYLGSYHGGMIEIEPTKE